MLTDIGAASAVEQLQAARAAFGIRTIHVYDGPHMDLYWIMSLAKTMAYAIKNGQKMVEVAEAKPAYHCIIESKYWADLLFAHVDPAETPSLGERLMAAYERGQISFIPHHALVDPWRTHEVLQEQNTAATLLKYRSRGIEPQAIFYAADLFGLPRSVHGIARKCGLTLFHTKGAGPELAANGVGLWINEEDVAGEQAVLSFAMPGGYGIGERFAMPAGSVSRDGFRVNEFLPTLEERVERVCEVLVSKLERYGPIYRQSGLTTMSFSIGVDYSLPNPHLTPVVQRINELLGEDVLRLGPPMQLAEEIRQGVAAGSIRTVTQTGRYDQAAEDNILVGSHLPRWQSIQYQSYKMQRAVLNGQLISAIASKLADLEYPYALWDMAREKTWMVKSHDETCWVDPNTETEVKGLAVEVIDAGQRQIDEAVGVLARPNWIGRNERRQNYYVYTNPDAEYSVVGLWQLGQRRELVLLPLIDGYRSTQLPDGGPSRTNELFWHAKRGGQLQAVTHTGEVLPVQIAKRWKRQAGKDYLRTYAAVMVELDGLSAVNLRLEKADVPQQQTVVASDTCMTNGRLVMWADAERRLFGLLDAQTGVSRLGWIVDQGDRGDLYTDDPFGQVIDSRTYPQASLQSRRRNGAGEVMQELEVTFSIDLPERLAPEEKGVTQRRMRRSHQLVTNTVTLLLRIYEADTARVDMEVEIDNQSRDHMLSLAMSVADAGEQVKMRHQDIILDAATFHPARLTDVREQPVHRFDSGLVVAGSLAMMKLVPLHRMVSDERGGAVIQIPLVYATGWLSHGDLQNRVGHTGGPGTKTEDAQSIGLTLMRLQLRTDAHELSDVELWRASTNFWRGPLPITAPGVAQTVNGQLMIEGDVGLRSIKRMELERETMVVSLTNPNIQQSAAAVANVPMWPTGLLEERLTEEPIMPGETILFAPGEQREFLW